ncbi:MAG: hypothetical protein AAGF11_26950 [Myxococcota bacterium]
MSSTVKLELIKKGLELGTHFARNKQWNNATSTYIEAIDLMFDHHLSRQTDVLDPIPQLADILAQNCGKLIVFSKDELHPLCKLRDALANTVGEPIEGDTMCAQVASNRNRWVLAYTYHQQAPSEGIIASGKSRSFVLELGDEMASIALTKTHAAQMSYAFAHYGLARVNSITNLYFQHQILISNGAHSILDAASHYHVALALSPDNPWAMAHLAEVYRNLANAWPASEASFYQSDPRVEYYCTAFRLYRRALKLKPNYPWAHAHFGAAVVNARVLIGADVDETSWLDEDRDKLLRDALDSLTQAQEISGNFYPWAQAYYAWALMLDGLNQRQSQHDPAQAPNRSYEFQDGALLSMLNLADAYFLQPEIMLNAFEPGELYDNAFLQFGLCFLWLHEFNRAWDYVRRGMRRLFKFHFIPGLQALMGFELLVQISAKLIATKQEPKLVAPHSTKVMGISIPGKPINQPKELGQFINQIVDQCCCATIDPFLNKEIELNSNIAIGMWQTYFILLEFSSILKDFDLDNSEITALMKRIVHRLKPSGDSAQWVFSPERLRNSDRLAMLVSGTPSHRIARQIRQIVNSTDAP